MEHVNRIQRIEDRMEHFGAVHDLWDKLRRARIIMSHYDRRYPYTPELMQSAMWILRQAVANGMEITEDNLKEMTIAAMYLVGHEESERIAHTTDLLVEATINEENNNVTTNLYQVIKDMIMIVYGIYDTNEDDVVINRLGVDEE